MEQPSLGVIIYVAIVAVVGLGVTARLLFWIARTERLRRERLEDRKLADAIRTNARDETRQEARERVISSIETHYTVTRRMLVPLVLVCTAALAAVPFLAEVPASAVSVVVAAITVIVGVAARPIVENAFAGLILAQSRHIHIGDTVKLDERYGIIEDITFTHTTVKLWDWRRLVVPNSQMLQKSFLNYSLHDQYLWSCTEVWVSMEEDLDKVRELAIEAVKKSENFAPYEEPRFWVMDMTRDAVLIWIAAWADTPGAGWVLTADIRTELLRAFRREGIQGHVHNVSLRSELPAAATPAAS